MVRLGLGEALPTWLRGAPSPYSATQRLHAVVRTPHDAVPADIIGTGFVRVLAPNLSSAQSPFELRFPRIRALRHEDEIAQCVTLQEYIDLGRRSHLAPSEAEMARATECLARGTAA
eukprot:5707931-Pleurochrysis_carterae.AAC.1